ncbi:MAG TPA: aldehyde dehydrogenase family protein [Chloroflexota bacterium]|nr:aldehyde dehydrogenase family protein [Chloroflexota bacterium]
MIEEELTQSSEAGSVFPAVDPATGKVLAWLPRGGAAEIDRAVAQARRAFEAERSWRQPATRARVLNAIARAIELQAEPLAVLESRDTGKPLTQARTDVTVAARYFQYYAGWADKVYGQQIPLGDGYLDYTLREPWGVCGQIIPWNYPLQVSSRLVAPALAVGNAVVLKPAEEASLTAVRLGEIARAEGLPNGLLQVITGLGEEAGAALVEHPGIDHLSFVGSPAVGALIAQAAARRLVPVSLELGGKSPQVVFPDADLDLAVPVIVRALIQNAGQTCSAGSRLIAHTAIYDELLTRLKERLETIRVGPGLEDPDLGPLISASQFERAHGMTQRAIAGGARLVSGGARAVGPALDAGYFFQPTLLADVSLHSEIWSEEVFGPVLAATSFHDEDEAVALANSTAYGLVAGLWTRDLSRAHRLSRRIRAGQVYINTFGAGGGVELPFGGYQRSGYGRGKGQEAILAFSQVKNICAAL